MKRPKGYRFGVGDVIKHKNISIDGTHWYSSFSTIEKCHGGDIYDIRNGYKSGDHIALDKEWVLHKRNKQNKNNTRTRHPLTTIFKP